MKLNHRTSDSANGIRLPRKATQRINLTSFPGRNATIPATTSGENRIRVSR
jgi:hypothetical protein